MSGNRCNLGAQFAEADARAPGERVWPTWSSDTASWLERMLTVGSGRVGNAFTICCGLWESLLVMGTCMPRHVNCFDMTQNYNCSRWLCIVNAGYMWNLTTWKRRSCTSLQYRAVTRERLRALRKDIAFSCENPSNFFYSVSRFHRLCRILPMLLLLGGFCELCKTGCLPTSFEGLSHSVTKDQLDSLSGTGNE